MIKHEQATLLERLARQRLEHFKQTREIEFKVNLALWTAIVLAGGTLYRSGFRLGATSEVKVFVGAAAVLWISHAIFWMIPIQYSEDTDSAFIREYRKKITAACGFPEGVPEPAFWNKPFWRAYRRLRESGWSWIVAETGVTLILCLLVGLVLKFAPVRS
ncbi:MAG: hypothetical protein WC700_01050 [Gemmatimonadaceae bacterium]|jgi:hypothetical protein